MTEGNEMISPIDLPVLTPKQGGGSRGAEEGLFSMNTTSNAPLKKGLGHRDHVESIVEFDAKFCSDIQTSTNYESFL